ncbi:hypothetical protein B0H17DRAFT_389662 [Mycena rosella]|uniref:SET domain-containing protein n=1 Tax=Mycena rosella TaxID=1033263 RepID=A0AAD7DPI9_MYCRO|nr:hypothetical protein B0H17DRAFT_389662 [Mycena rosella]
MTDYNAVAALLSWCSDHGYWIDSRIQLIAGPCGVAVFSKDTTIPVDSILVRIPRESVLSVKSSPISELIPPHPYGRGAQLSLALALSVELLNGTASPWSAYLESLPRKIPGIPLFWTSGGRSQNDDLTRWLNGTEAGKMLFDARDNHSGLLSEISEYFHQVAQPVYSKVFQSSPGRIPSLSEFYLAYALVSSRAFLVDSYHGLAMVPIADAFNHTQENHVHLESDFDVCPECGSLHRCVHDDTTESEARATIPEDADDFYEMVANMSIPPHTEVFNTYGETLSNAELLVQYGFILDGNENDRLTWTLRDLARFSENYLSPSGSWGSVGGLARFEDLLGSLTALPWDDISESEMMHVDRAHAFCLNGDATISHDLWLYFALMLLCLRNKATDYSRNAVVVLLKEMLQCQIALELHLASGDAPHLPGDDDGASPYGLILELARLLASLLRSRSERAGSSTTAELGDILDSLPNDDDDDATSTKMAISLAMTEHSLLDSCTAAWEGLAQCLA